MRQVLCDKCGKPIADGRMPHLSIERLNGIGPSMISSNYELHDECFKQSVAELAAMFPHYVQSAQVTR